MINSHGRAFRLSLLADSAALRDACAALRARGDDGVGASPAWRLGARVPPRAETAVQRLLMLSHALAAAVEDAQGSHGMEAMLRRTLSGPERAHVECVVACVDSLQGFLSRAGATLAHMRLGASGPYLEASVAVLDAMVALVDAIIAGNIRRIVHFGGWTSECDPRSRWRSTFIEHAVASGAMLPAVPGRGLGGEEVHLIDLHPSSCSPLAAC